MSDQKQHWWKEGVVYQIYPRSFMDSNDDGIGDIPGVTQHLDYLQWLGVDAIWFSPLYPSPMYDFGYDVQDYCAIGREFGTMEQFKELLAEAHRRQIRIILDLVFNHTSHLHPWFQEARSSLDNPYRDWYIWSPAIKGRPPNNWQAVFGGRAWEWDEATGQYYLHSFTPEQPDLNWRNPQVKEALFKVMEFWLNLGVDGFRLDVVNFFLKDEELRNNPYKPGWRPYDMQKHIFDRDRPETIELMKEIRKVTDKYPDIMTVGEVAIEDPAQAARYYGEGEGLHLNFNFSFLEQPWQARAFRTSIEKWNDHLQNLHWPTFTLSNHDRIRHFTRYGQCRGRARVAAALLISLRGTPFLYYGEEIGMANGRIPKKMIQDPWGRRYWPFHKGRDGCRTPMQWNDTHQGGFTTGHPWLPLNKNYREINVEQQRREPSSLLHFYRRLLAYRRRSPALRRGSLHFLSDLPSPVLGYRREEDGEKILILLNFSSHSQKFALPSIIDRPEVVFHHLEDPPRLQGRHLTLPGHGVAFLQYF